MNRRMPLGRLRCFCYPAHPCRLVKNRDLCMNGRRFSLAIKRCQQLANQCRRLRRIGQIRKPH